MANERRYRRLPALLILLALVTLVTAAACVSYVQARLLADAGQRLAMAAADIADALDRVLFERYGDAQVMADTLAPSIASPPAVTRHLNRIKERYLLYRWLGVADAAGRVVASTDPASLGADWSREPSFQAARRGNGVQVAQSSASEGTGGAPAVSFTAPIRNAAGDFLGVVTSRVGLSELEDLTTRTVARSEAQQGGSRIEWQFLTEDGALIADSMLRQEGRVNLQRLRVASVLRALAGDAGYLEERHERREVPVVTGYARTEGYAEFTGLRWVVLLRMDRDDVLAPIRVLVWKLVISGAAVFALLLGLLFWMGRRLIREWALSEERSRALQLLEETTRHLSEEANFDLLLTRLVEAAQRLTGARYAALGVFRDQEDGLAHFATAGVDDELRRKMGPPPTGRGLLGHLAREEGVLRLKDLMQHPSAAGFPPHHPLMRSFLGVSVRAHGRVIGRFYLTEKEGAEEFSDLDAQIMTTMALAAGAAIEKHQLISDLRRAESRSRALLNSTSEGIYGVDADGRCLFINQAGASLLGYRPEDLLGQPMHALLHHTRADGAPYPMEDCPILGSFRHGRPCRLDHEVFWRKDGTSIPVDYSAAPLEENGRVQGAVVTFTDSTQRKAVEARLNELAYYDSLTELPNRRLFLTLLSRAVAQSKRTGRSLALLFLDVDRFKIINDTLGHARADGLLQAFAGRLKACIRETDTVARLGGDEFTIILEALASADEAAMVARRVLEALSLPFALEGREVFITSSIGIALFPSEHTTAETLITCADTAMYAAKEHGACFRFFSPEMNTRADQRLSLETSLRRALQRQEFLLHYQPQVDVRTGRIVAVEALLRWWHPEQGMVSPGDFIPLAEETGLIVPVGEWVLHSACVQGRAWQQALPDLRVAVNLSRRQFEQPTIVDTIRRILDETGLAPGALDLELTESLLIHNTERTIATLKALHELGIRLSIDDFGTGYSSLNYLKHLPVAALKIDRSFVRNVVTNPKDASIVKAIVTLARCLDLAVVAEGVETRDQERALLALDCSEMQGFHFSLPLPPEDLTRLLDRSAARRSRRPPAGCAQLTPAV